MTTKKLSAIVFADIVGYTASMGKDEQAALHSLEELRKIVYPLAAQHHGIVLKEIGDAALMQFDNALDAVQCSVELQKGVSAVPRLKLRIGIHLGDVVVEEKEGTKDILGDAVNIASRIQPIAVPGGIVVTEDVWKQISNNPNYHSVSLGARRLKGVRTPVTLHALTGEHIVTPSLKQRVTQRQIFRRSVLTGALLLVALLAYLLSNPEWQNTEVPSIAFLHLKNLGTEQDEPYCYGITQDLIVDVAKAGLIRVAPMQDIMSLPKEPLSIEDIAKKLRVHYVMEGTLTHESNVFRIAAHIVDAITKKNLLEEKIEVPVANASALEGKLADIILKKLSVKSSAVAKDELTRQKTTNPEAYEYYLRAKYLFDHKKTKDDVSVARGLYEQASSLDSSFILPQLGLGSTYELDGNYDQALALYKRALALAQADDNKLEEGKSQLRLGAVCWYQADYPKALEYYLQSLTTMQELGDREGEGRVLNNIGLVYDNRGDYPKALEYYSKSLRIRQDLGDRQAEGVTLGNIGIVYSNQGDYPKALEYYFKDLNMMQELGDRHGEGAQLGNIGNVYNNEGDYPKALEYYFKSLRISRDLGDRYVEGTTLDNIGIVYNGQGDYPKALDYCLKSLDITRAIGLRSAEGCDLTLFGQIYYEEQEYRRAIDSLKKAIAIFEKIVETDNVLWATSWLARAEIESGNPKDAEEHTLKVEELFKTLPHPRDIIEICWNLSQVYDGLSNKQRAKEYFKRAFDELQASAGKISDSTMRQSYLKNLKTNREIVAAYTQSEK